MDLAQAVGAAETISLAGADYQVRLLTMTEWGHSISSYIKANHPSPVTVAGRAIQEAKDAGEPLDPSTQEMMLGHAHRAARGWPPRLGTDAWFEALNSIEGSDAVLLYEVLRRTDPAFTEARARELAPKLSSDEWGELLRASLWGGQPRPKGGSGTGATTSEPNPQTPPTTPTSGTTASPG